MGYSYDGLDLNASPYGVTSRPQLAGAPLVLAAAAFGTRPGGRVSAARAELRRLVLTGEVEGTSAADLETNLATLKRTLARPNRRLVCGHIDNRFYVARHVALSAAPEGPLAATWSAEFVLETPFALAPTPAADVRTLALALAPGETTVYRQQVSVTPGGDAATPVRAILVSQAGGVTPTLWQLSNLTALSDDPAAPAVALRLGTNAQVAAGSALVLDGARGEVWAAALTNVAGWWPLEDAAGSALDFSGQSRDLSANGTPDYRQDSELGPCLGFDGTTGEYLDSAAAAFGLTGDITVGAWIYLTALGAARGIIGKAANLTGWVLRVTSANKLEFGVGSGAATRIATGATSLEANRWYFAAGRWNNATDTATVLLNALMDGQTSGSALAAAAAGNNLRVGAAHNLSGTAEGVLGRIAHPFVASAALTDTQLRQVMDRHLVAGLGTQQPWSGVFPTLAPPAGATNTVEYRADHGTTAPTARASLSWRARYE